MSASFRSILQQVTQEKLEELKLQKNLMTSHFNPILEQLATDASKKGKPGLSLLYQAVKNSPVKDTIDSVLIENLKYVLQNGEQDPSLSDQLVTAWTDRVKGEIQYALRKCEYSYLYGSLLSEWLEVEEKRRRKGETRAEGPDEAMEVEGAGDDKNKGKEAREKVISSLRRLMFTPPTKEEFEPEQFRKFLTQELFTFGDNVEGETAFLQVVKESGEFFRPENYYISTHDVQCCIKGLTSDELLSQEKKSALKELSANQEALDEVATLLTSRLKNLDRWEWPSNICEDGTEVRRGLAGEYKAFLNEDIITALFLQYVGVEWAAFFKRQFKGIYDSRAWERVDCRPFSIEGYRREFHKTAFLAALPDSIESQENKNKDEYARVECEEEVMSYSMQQMNAMMAPAMSFGAGGTREATTNSLFGSAQPQHERMKKRMVCPPPPRVPKPPTDIDFKQQFLHNLCTEMKLNQVLRPENPFLVVQADLESFGPSVIHEAVLIALEVLGVHKRWLSFFKKFLQPKIKFGEGEQPQTIVRGVPAAHVLSNFFGETMMFLLDFLVNKKCKGMKIYRISDELWFWGHESEHVSKAWETLQSYGKMVGLKVNQNRSGSVAVFSEAELVKRFKELEKATIVCGPSPLPQKNIHWGYLSLHSNGVFCIDQKAVTKFLEEMKGLLEKSECVLEWINIFNKYFTFFIRNFGKSAVASGKQHLDQIVKALNQIYSGLSTSDPVGFLKARFVKLMEADIVDAWVYWPLERGGLGLVNPFIGVMALRETFAEDEKNDAERDRDFTKLPLQDKILWEEMKKNYEHNYGPVTEAPVQMARIPGGFQGPRPPVAPKLPTWEEYVASRETDLEHWQRRFLHLLERPGPKYPPVSDQFHTIDWRSEDEIEKNYFMWLFSYYETQLKGHFGSVTFINSKLLPMSMIANIQKTKVKHN